jgi:putative ABC transport system permease protein
LETLRIASTALRAHKLRSFLTLLGVIIGVMTVVTVVGIIGGLNNFIREKVFSLNPDIYVITQFGIITSQEAYLEAIKRKKIDWQDFRLVEQHCKSCASVGAGQTARANVKRGAKNLDAVIIRGFTANVREINKFDIEAGRSWTPMEDRHSSRVAVIGSDIRDELYPGLDPIGRTIWIDGQPVRVIGLLVKRGALFGQSQDRIVFMPVTAWRKQYGTRDSIDIFVRAKGGMEGMDESLDEVRTILRARRRTAFRADDPFGVVTAEALQMLWKGISAGLFSLMILISSISLIVGGIVITNIMLVSVVERTREIGVRRAIGATRKNIRRQFLTEAVLLALGGGILGLLLGYTITKVITKFTSLPTLVSPTLVLSALGIALLTGLTAGIVPAIRASRLPPVEALRWE